MTPTRHTGGRHLSGYVWTVTALIVLAAAAAVAQDAREWNKPFTPFRVIGNVYYVGTNELGAYLLTTPSGHVLIDGGLPESAALIEDSIRQLGFAAKDIRILLTTQAHFDHVGSMAALAGKSGATVMVMDGDAQLVERGGHGDYLFGDRLTYTPVKVGRVLTDGDTVELGGLTLVAHATRGHTPGCTTWTTGIVEDGHTYAVVFPGSTSVNPGTRLVHRPSYPGIREDYERSFAFLASLKPDVFLGAHGSFFDLEGKRARQVAGSKPNPFIDPTGYAEVVNRMRTRFDQAVAAEQKSTP
jgi:metallo-beta-lactamase class B